MTSRKENDRIAAWLEWGTHPELMPKINDAIDSATEWAVDEEPNYVEFFAFARNGILGKLEAWFYAGQDSIRVGKDVAIMVVACREGSDKDMARECSIKRAIAIIEQAEKEGVAVWFQSTP